MNRSRRFRFGVRAGAIALAATLGCAGVIVATSREMPRWDVTAWGDQGLSARALRALERVPGPCRLVLAGPWSAPEGTPGVPGRAAQREVFDLLREMDRAHGPFAFTPVDTLSPEGQATYMDVLKGLAARDQAQVGAWQGALDRASLTLEEGAAALGSWSPVFEQARDALPGGADADAARKAFDMRAGVVRILASQARQRRAEARTRGEAQVGGVPVGALDDAAGMLRAALTRLDADLASLEGDLGASATGTLPGEARARVEAIAGAIGPLRERMRLGADELARLTRPDVLRVARLLERGPAAIIIGPPELGLTAISLDALFPPGAEDVTGGSLRRHAEDVVTTALGTLVNPDAPIVVLMHAEGSASLLESGAMNAMRARLELRRVTFVEWPVTQRPAMPVLSAADPDGRRPVVYVALGTDASSGIGQDAGLSGPARAAALGRALHLVVDAGKPLLVSLAPSPAPSWGGTDDAAAVLGDFGLRADSGRPILGLTQTPQGAQVDATMRVQALEGEHAVLGAVKGLPTVLRWCLPLSTLPGHDDVMRVPAIEVARAGAWAEAEWLGLWRFFAQQRVEAAAGAGLPTPNEGVDDLRGPWTVAYFAERRLRDGVNQRLVVVGANGWFFDSQTLPSVTEDGRTVLANPGNSEFFDASISWLAGQDDLIAPGPAARAVARVRPMSEGRQRLLGWLIIAGLPLAILGLGVVVRVARR
ncbi:MAG: hypothetical protein IT439_05130 [Phycisphaerales bacterium]|nr:hypothetical protein [Phycisphaerales bacterium]